MKNSMVHSILGNLSVFCQFSILGGTDMASRNSGVSAWLSYITGGWTVVHLDSGVLIHIGLQ